MQISVVYVRLMDFFSSFLLKPSSYLNYDIFQDSSYSYFKTGIITANFSLFSADSQAVKSQFCFIFKMSSILNSPRKLLSSGSRPALKAIVDIWCAKAIIWTQWPSSFLFQWHSLFQRIYSIVSGVIYQGARPINRFSVRRNLSFWGYFSLENQFMSPPDRKKFFNMRAITQTEPNSAAAFNATKQALLESTLPFSKRSFSTARCFSRQLGKQSRNRQRCGTYPQNSKSSSSRYARPLGTGVMKGSGIMSVSPCRTNFLRSTNCQFRQRLDIGGSSSSGCVFSLNQLQASAVCLLWHLKQQFMSWPAWSTGSQCSRSSSMACLRLPAAWRGKKSASSSLQELPSSDCFLYFFIIISYKLQGRWTNQRIFLSDSFISDQRISAVRFQCEIRAT